MAKTSAIRTGDAAASCRKLQNLPKGKFI